MPIVRTADTLGGKARIEGHRLSVIWVLDTIAALSDPERVREDYGPEAETVIADVAAGRAAEVIARYWGNCPGGVTAEEIREALAWAEAHPEEVAADRAAYADAWRRLRATPGVIESAAGLYAPPGVAPKKPDQN